MIPTCEPQERLTIRFKGSMDTARCDEMGPDIRAQLAGANQPVAFDLSGVDFISSSFLSLCVYAQRQAGDHGFQVINVCPMVKRVLKIAGLDAMLGPE
jgi:anti-anti-sigma factor